MTDDQADRWFRKLVLLALLLVWTVLVLDLTDANPERWVLYGLTAVVFLIAGRMWDLELEKIDVPGLSIGSNDPDHSHEDDRDQ